MSNDVYIAGPLFTEGDRWYLEKIDLLCKKNGLSTYLPHRDAGLCPAGEKGTLYFFEEDYKNLDSASLIIAVLHGADIDSGTAWEIGYAYANKKTIFAIAEDIRIAGDITKINLMISNSSEIYFEFNKLEHAVQKYALLRGRANARDVNSN